VNGKGNILRQVLEKFRLTRPVPAELRARILATKGPRFREALRRTGDYTPLFGAAAWLFFLLRRFGIGVSVAGSAVILAVTAVTLATAVSAGAYFAAVRTAPPLPGSVEKSEGAMIPVPATVHPAAKDAAPDPAPEDPDVVRNRSGVALFTAAGAERETVLKVTDTVARELAQLMGNEKIVSLRLGRRKVGRMILGSVEKLEGTYTITARVVGVADSKIISFVTESAATKDELEEACRKIAHELARHIE